MFRLYKRGWDYHMSMIEYRKNRFMCYKGRMLTYAYINITAQWRYKKWEDALEQAINYLNNIPTDHPEYNKRQSRVEVLNFERKALIAGSKEFDAEINYQNGARFRGSGN